MLIHVCRSGRWTIDNGEFSGEIAYEMPQRTLDEIAMMLDLDGAAFDAFFGDDSLVLYDWEALLMSSIEKYFAIKGQRYTNDIVRSTAAILAWLSHPKWSEGPAMLRQR